MAAAFKPFEASDWKVEFLDPASIHAGSAIRKVRNEGIRVLVDSITATGWDPTSFVIVYRDPSQAQNADPPRYLCLDGMHRVHAVRELQGQGIVRWPSDWPADAATGHVRMPCCVLVNPISERDVILHAFMRNRQTGSVVQTSFLNILTSIKASAGVIVPQKGDDGVPPNPSTEERKAIVAEVSKLTGHSIQTVSADVSTYLALEKQGMLQELDEFEKEHGHGWFTRKTLRDLRPKPSFKFGISVLKAWMETSKRSARSTGGGAEDAARGGSFPTEPRDRALLYGKIGSVSHEYYSAMMTHCQTTRTNLAEACCSGNTLLLANARDFVAAAFASATAEGAEKTSEEVMKELLALVNEVHKSRYPAVPRRALARSTRSQETQQVQAAASGSQNSDGAAASSSSTQQTPRVQTAASGSQASDGADAASINSQDSQTGGSASASASQTAGVAAVSSAARSSATAGVPPMHITPLNSSDGASGGSRSDQTGQLQVVQEIQAVQPGSQRPQRVKRTLFPGGFVESATRVRRQKPRIPISRSAPLPSPPAQTGEDSDGSEDFDDDARPQAEIDNPKLVSASPARNNFAPRVIPDGSAIFRFVDHATANRLFGLHCFPGDEVQRDYLAEFYKMQLYRNGVVVVRDFFRDVPAGRESEVFVKRGDIDAFYAHFADAFEADGYKCCEAGIEVWAPICNDQDTSDEMRETSLRFQATKPSSHQHLETHHKDVFMTKLYLDVAGAMLFRALAIEGTMSHHFAIPKTGGRVLLSAPQCPAQPPHTDYRVRSESAAPASNPSYFMVQTGKEAATLLVWQASHYTATHFEHALQRARLISVEEVAMVKATEEKCCEALLPQRMTIPAYSVLVGRGDLVHAGDSYNGVSPTLRYHIHCTYAGDKVANSIYIRPFGE